MPPRGRPPGRKSTTLSTPTPSSATSTPKPPSRQQATPQKSKQGGPKTSKKSGRPPRTSSIHPPAVDDPAIDAASDAPPPSHPSHPSPSSPQPQIMKPDPAPNGIHHPHPDSSPAREVSVVSDGNSVVMADASEPPRPPPSEEVASGAQGLPDEAAAAAAAPLAAASSPQPGPMPNGAYVRSSSTGAADAAAWIARGRQNLLNLPSHRRQSNGRANDHSNGAGPGAFGGPVAPPYYRHPPHHKNANGKRTFSSYADPSVDLEEIKYRQKSEDIDAYVMDLDFCTSQLALPNLTPQESRTLQLRQLDLSHQIRSCHHDREMLEAQRLLRGGRPLGVSNGSSHIKAFYHGHPSNGDRAAPPRPGLPTAPKHGLSASALADVPVAKRARASSAGSGQDTISVGSGGGGSGGGGSSGGSGSTSNGIQQQYPDNATTAQGASDYGYSLHNGAAYSTPMAGGAGRGSPGSDDEDRDTTNSLQRLGYWKCRLCESEKYMLAGAARQPSAPSKWPLKDMGKLMSHYFDMHTEHEPDERCAELGDALDRNRGPFEYWLRKSRAQRITDRTVIDKVVEELRAGRVPKTLRDLCRAAAAFPGA